MQEQREPSLRDYERDLWEMEARQRSFRRFQQIFQIYMVFGALIGFGALAYFLFRKLDIELSYLDQMILLTSGSGFAISVMSGLFLFLRRQRQSIELERNRYMTAAAEFLLQWARFENVGRERLEAKGRDFNRMSVRAITEELLNAGVITKDDLVQLDEVLRFRNLLVHSGTPADPTLLAKMTETLKRVMTRVEA
jgi:hypothetical protein